MNDSVFQSLQAQQIIKYVFEKYQDKLQFLWQKFPKNAIWRQKNSKKWYGALLVIQRNKLGLESNDLIDIIDLRAQPETISNLVDGKKYFSGYHMNKRNWLTICLDGSVPTEKICYHIDESYKLSML